MLHFQKYQLVLLLFNALAVKEGQTDTARPCQLCAQSWQCIPMVERSTGQEEGQDFTPTG